MVHQRSGFLEGAAGVGREQNLMSSGLDKCKVLLEQRGGVQQAAEPLAGSAGVRAIWAASEVWESLRYLETSVRIIDFPKYFSSILSNQEFGANYR